MQERLRGLSQKEDETQSRFREEVLAPPPEGSDDPIRGLALCDVYRELRRFDAVNDLPRPSASPGTSSASREDNASEAIPGPRRDAILSSHTDGPPPPV